MQSNRLIEAALLATLLIMVADCASVATPSAAKVTCDNQAKRRGHGYTDCLRDINQAVVSSTPAGL